MAVSSGKSYTKSKIRIVELPEFRCKAVLVSSSRTSFAILPSFYGSGDIYYGMHFFNGSRERKGLRLPTLEEAQDILDNSEKIDKLMKEIGVSEITSRQFWIADDKHDEKYGYFFNLGYIGECLKTRVIGYRCVVDY